ncbi:sulfotransferase family protein [Beggiatoa alba B18LD]|uniref:Sulfotransferase family protein n=1 Tax=Beggiatoa alba B18LD TaxID=395493 RepID=I3CDC0_9GAMM|nr:sulfotransferase [Beggiatoa alba]EIJ41613.1 sulfotransferase family protein [Beggiatoa alba B18LD]
MHYCFTFVCQQGELEIKALLLAISLKTFLRCNYELVATVPTPATDWGTPQPSTLELLKSLGVRVVPITNWVDTQYPIGNKIACLGIETSAEKIFFLDSDILCYQEFTPAYDWLRPVLHAKPVDLGAFTTEPKFWTSVYELFNLPVPARYVFSSVSQELLHPYFNAGFLGIPNQSQFAQTWADSCRRILQSGIIAERPRWLDQLALPVTLARLGMDFSCLDERFNYPAHLKPFHPQAVLCHYHKPSVLRREPALNQVVNRLVRAYPALQQQMANLPEWDILSKPYQVEKKTHWFSRSPPLQPSAQQARPEAFITGLPRSGTSYLCRLLHKVENCVVINEPTQIFQPLQQPFPPYQIALYYQEVRRDILNGQAIENKIKDGEVIEDTAIIDTRETYLPSVYRPDFVLFTKNTLAYLARMQQLRTVMPHAPIIVCVRHPIDTIASWKGTFNHLKQASVETFPVGHYQDSALAGWQRQRLQRIADTVDVALKRVLLWCYLAETILSVQTDVHLVRYEQLVLNPVDSLRTIFQKIPQAPTLHLPASIQPSEIRHKRTTLDAHDLQLIDDLCSEYLHAFGYNKGGN